jgi:uncharacterized protein (TIGR02217 family)
MQPFSEARLPVRLAFGSSGGVERRTEVTVLASGREARATPWSGGRRRYALAAALRSLDDTATLLAFFEARRGRLQGFRLTDFADHASCLPSATPGPRDQPLGTGDGAATAFQLVKAYGEGADAFLRPIAKPVDGSVRVAVAGVELAAGSGFSIDPSRGLVTLARAPAAGAAVTAGYLFDTPVRFDTDRIEVVLETFDSARTAATPLIEVRV